MCLEPMIRAAMTVSEIVSVPSIGFMCLEPEDNENMDGYRAGFSTLNRVYVLGTNDDSDVI